MSGFDTIRGGGGAYKIFGGDDADRLFGAGQMWGESEVDVFDGLREDNEVENPAPGKHLDWEFISTFDHTRPPYQRHRPDQVIRLTRIPGRKQ